jgi:hypothetical protein
MKTLITICIALTAYGAFGQTKKELPRTEFAIDLSESSVTIRPGESKSVNVLITRSKYFANVKAKFGFSSALPKGVTVRFEPAEGLVESSVATIVVAADAPAGSYSLVPDATLSHKTKGTILKLVVTSENVASK